MLFIATVYGILANTRPKKFTPPNPKIERGLLYG